jgi:histidinol-phosphatase (PHP family)
MTDLHVHTTYSDGRSTPEEVVQAAIAKGMTTLGFSDHSYTHFDTAYCIPKDKIPAYRAEIEALKAQYAGQIEILCGIEQDFYSEESTEGYDYVIGSVHYVKAGGKYLPVDESRQALLRAVQEAFSGDFYALAEAYYQTVALVAEKLQPTIIGHFDLISKFNEDGKLFDETHPRYIAAWQAAADRLLKAEIPFEINTGAVSRGYRTAPYPAASIREYLANRGAQFLWSSDSHRADTLCFGFPND